jgi:isopenicillin-N epimerase
VRIDKIGETALVANLRELFLLDHDVVFLNHGSFGACPRPVFDVYQQWQRELERQPVEFLGRRSDALLDDARNKLGAYLKADADNLIFVTNATQGINIVARSLKLQPGDEVLTTNHEYGAVDHTWQFVCEKTGANYVPCPIPLPIESSEAVVETLWSAVTPRTKVIAISHITSPTALIFPIAEICRRAREAGILTVIDGAHVPGQIPLDLKSLGADFYSGNCHKWMCAPKGSGFLYARPEHHHLVEPSTISWGWIPDSTFVVRNQWQGTRDIAAFLSVPAAIDFMRTNNWEVVRLNCHQLALDTRNRIVEMTGLPAIAPETWIAQMFTVWLPVDNALEFTPRLYEQFRVEVPGIDWNGSHGVRVSVQGYNTFDDANALIDALYQTLQR